MLRRSTVGAGATVRTTVVRVRVGLGLDLRLLLCGLACGFLGFGFRVGLFLRRLGVVYAFDGLGHGVFLRVQGFHIRLLVVNGFLCRVDGGFQAFTRLVIGHFAFGILVQGFRITDGLVERVLRILDLLRGLGGFDLAHGSVNGTDGLGRRADVIGNRGLRIAHVPQHPLVDGFRLRTALLRLTRLDTRIQRTQQGLVKNVRILRCLGKILSVFDFLDEFRVDGLRRLNLRLIRLIRLIRGIGIAAARTMIAATAAAITTVRFLLSFSPTAGTFFSSSVISLPFTTPRILPQIIQLHICSHINVAQLLAETMAERINADMDWTQYTREFEMNLRRIRAQRGYSQERVAYDAGMSRLQYQRLEGGGSSKDRPANPTAKTLIALATVLDVSIDELLPTPWPDLRAR